MKTITVKISDEAYESIAHVREYEKKMNGITLTKSDVVNTAIKGYFDGEYFLEPDIKDKRAYNKFHKLMKKWGWEKEEEDS